MYSNEEVLALKGTICPLPKIHPGSEGHFLRIFEPYGEEKLRKYKGKYERERNVVPSWIQKSSHPAVQKRERSKKPAPFEPVRIRTPPDYFVEAPLFPTNGTFGGGLREEFSPFSLCSEGDSEFVTPPTSPIPSRTPTPPPDPVSRTSTTSSMEEEKEDALPSCSFIVKTRSTDSEEATAWSQEIEKRSRFSAPKKIMKKEEVKEKNEDIQPLDLFSQNNPLYPPGLPRPPPMFAMHPPGLSAPSCQPLGPPPGFFQDPPPLLPQPRVRQPLISPEEIVKSPPPGLEPVVDEEKEKKKNDITNDFKRQILKTKKGDELKTLEIYDSKPDGETILGGNTDPHYYFLNNQDNVEETKASETRRSSQADSSYATDESSGQVSPPFNKNQQNKDPEMEQKSRHSSGQSSTEPPAVRTGFNPSAPEFVPVTLGRMHRDQIPAKKILPITAPGISSRLSYNLNAPEFKPSGSMDYGNDVEKKETKPEKWADVQENPMKSRHEESRKSESPRYWKDEEKQNSFRPPPSYWKEPEKQSVFARPPSFQSSRRAEKPPAYSEKDYSSRGTPSIVSQQFTEIYDSEEEEGYVRPSPFIRTTDGRVSVNPESRAPSRMSRYAPSEKESLRSSRSRPIHPSKIPGFERYNLPEPVGLSVFDRSKFRGSNPDPTWTNSRANRSTAGSRGPLLGSKFLKRRDE